MATEKVPARLGKYEVRFRLASGGMGSVYLGRARGQGGIEKVVAIKTLNQHLTHDDSLVRMFLDEARLSTAINHPNVCSVFDFGEQDGLHYMVMEYLDGEPISKVLKHLSKTRETDDHSRLPPMVARLIADAAEGLHAAHELRAPDGSALDVVHRDVSPQNIFLTYDGAVKVVDFGVAHAKQRMEETKAGEIKGKYEYVAPEQVHNKAVDRRTDLWSLGVVTWELLTLKRLFRREGFHATLSAIAREDIPAPSSVAPWVPKELDDIVLSMLQKKAADRPASARAVARSLRTFLQKSTQFVDAQEMGEWLTLMFPEDRDKRLKQQRAVKTAEDSDVRSLPQELSVGSGISRRSSHDLTAATMAELAPVGALVPTSFGEEDDDDEPQESTSIAPPPAPSAPVAVSPPPPPAPSAPPVVSAPSAAPPRPQLEIVEDQHPTPAHVVPLTKPKKPKRAPEPDDAVATRVALPPVEVDDAAEASAPPRAKRAPGAMRAIALVLVGLVVFGLGIGGAVLYKESLDAPPAKASVPPIAKPPEPPRPTLAAVTPPVEPPVAPPVEDAGAVEVVDAGAPPVVDAGVPVVTPPPPEVPDAGALVGAPTPVTPTPKPPKPVVKPPPPKEPAIATPPPPPKKEPTTPVTQLKPGAASTGRLKVRTTNGSAEVLIDGQRVGVSPLTIDLPVGTHTIELRAKGVAFGGPQTINVHFAAEYVVEVDLGG